MTITTLADLDEITARHQDGEAGVAHTLRICSGAGCVSSASDAVVSALEQELGAAGLAASTLIKQTGCLGICDAGPTLIIEPGGDLYCRLNPGDARDIVQRHLLGGQVVERLCYRDPQTGAPVPKLADIPFFARQQKLVLRNCGTIDFRSLEEYIAGGGYRAAHKALTTMNPEEVVAEITASGLRGRGGGGFPTGLKWKLAAAQPGPDKYVICNADEGDPGAFMDRSLLEGDPHAVIEGMIIAGHGIGASRGVVYVRAEYPIAVHRLALGLHQARAHGLLGENLFGTASAFDIEIRIGAGAFVCGEETALMGSVEGRRGEPRQKPPYPSDAGLFGKPTIINNVETFGSVAQIIDRGSEWFASIGTATSRGTKVFALAGDITNTGLVEVPMGVTLGEIIFDIGGGVPHGKRFKVAQTGGPSGGCLTAEHLNTPVDYESLVELGAIMGSGGLIVMDSDTCMVDVARFFMEFCADESCGKCLACRVGTTRMLEILTRITEGHGREGDVELLIELGESIRETALCGLGQTAANPVLSTIRYFREEYDEHIRHHHCRAGVCSNLFTAPCMNACPAGVNVPGYLALIAAGRPVDAYRLVQQDNPFPSVCGRVCTHPCEAVCRRAQFDEALAIHDLKRYAADEAFKVVGPQIDRLFPHQGKSIGIIGAGPSGLTAGYYLRRLGYDVDVYEEQPVAGGMLAFGIPEYRLPKDTLDREIDTIRGIGVRIHTGVTVGADVTFADLRARHDAVYIAAGTQVSRRVGIPGEDLPGVVHGIDFLRRVNLGEKKPVSGVVAVIGGGSTAMDAARVARRLGASEVHVLYRRRIDDMPADHREIEEAIEEGVVLHELLAPVAIEGADRACGVRCQPMMLGAFDSSGRRAAVPSDAPEVVFAADLVIPAVSQQVDLPFLQSDEVQLTHWGTFLVDAESQMTTLPGVFAGGDVVRGSDVVITAIADGKKAASAIDRYLGGTGELNKGTPIEIPPAPDEDDITEHACFAMRYLPPRERTTSFEEVAQGFHRLDAVAEAMRCLRCERR
jgi:NADH-quinone oxidoreductase subunit F